MVERYCQKCIDKVFERPKSEPEEPEKVAEYYGCQMGDIRTDTPAIVS